jgi:2-methylisocitrate lyase-like PEP mutase family enzyme
MKNAIQRNNRMPNLAETFHSLHKQNDILILPNAWDASSAKVIEDAGAKAIATSSAGVAWALGYADGDVLPPRMLAELTARITDVIRIPLSVDFEGGYTKNPAEIAENLKPIINAGAVGINIEDGEGTLELLAQKIEKARKAAESAGVNVFINARTDVYLAEIGSPESRAKETIDRAARYREAGADGIFVPGLSDPSAIKAIVSEVKMPVNVMAYPGLPPAKELKKLGVQRLSSGTGIPQMIWSRVAELAKGFLSTGDSKPLFNNSMAYGKLQKLFTR